MKRRHDPNKNRAVCVLAKGSVWGLRGLLALTLTFIAGGLLLIAFDKLRADFNWTQAGKIALALLVLATFYGICMGIIWLLSKWYQWAKSYAKDC